MPSIPDVNPLQPPTHPSAPNETDEFGALDGPDDALMWCAAGGSVGDALPPARVGQGS
jgi:hypothetical protein